MIPPFLIRRLALALFLTLTACIPRDEARLKETPPAQPVPPAATPAEEEVPWKKVAEREGWAFLKVRQEGAVNLLVYGGLKDGVKESGGASAVMDAGWDLLTLSPNASDGPAGDRSQFFEFALGQPGYRRKILVTSGADLPAVVRLRPDTLSGLVIIRPGDAGFPEPEVRSLLTELPDNLPVLLLLATDENHAAAYYIASLIRAENKQIRAEPSIGTKRLLDGRILNFLHSLRYPSEFIESRKTFRKGCRLTSNGAWVIAHVSGERADGYCPLLLRFGGDVYRAVGVLKDAGCDYGITSAPSIRCY